MPLGNKMKNEGAGKKGIKSKSENYTKNWVKRQFWITTTINIYYIPVS